MNICCFSGKLAYAPQLRYTKSRLPICNAGLRVRDVFVALAATGQLAETLSKMRDGQYVQVTGSLDSNEWITRDGEKRQKFVILVISLGSSDDAAIAAEEKNHEATNTLQDT